MPARRMQGVKQMQALIGRKQAGLLRKAGAALFAEAQIEMAESKRRVPVDTGVLRASGYVNPPVAGFGLGGGGVAGTVRVELGYGGPAEDYAVIVHEDLDAFHRVGEAKFLESVLNESAPFMAQRIAKRINLEDED